MLPVITKMICYIEFGEKHQIYYYAKFINDSKDWIGKGDFCCNTPEAIAHSTKYALAEFF